MVENVHSPLLLSLSLLETLCIVLFVLLTSLMSSWYVSLSLSLSRTHFLSFSLFFSLPLSSPLFSSLITLSSPLFLSLSPLSISFFYTHPYTNLTLFCLPLSLSPSLSLSFLPLQDSMYRRKSLDLLLEVGRENPHLQYILITPQDISSIDASESVRVLELEPPERGQTTLI